MKTILPLLSLLLLQTTGLAQADTLRLNHITVLGSHNSYKTLPDKGLYRLMRFFSKAPKGIDYSHEPFEVQLDSFGIRSFELDIYPDPKGGHFYKRYANRLALKSAKSRIPELKEPGLKLLHIPDIDYNTLHPTFKGALRTLKAWSDKHPNHLPIFILVETKDAFVSDRVKWPKFTPRINWTAADIDSIDAEIEAVFGRNSPQVLTPDAVRGAFPSLNTMATSNGWPILNKCLGKFIFIMEGAVENAYAIGEHEGLKGRQMFIYSKPGKPECAFVILNDAIAQEPNILTTVKQGYMVRTRADGGTNEARNGDYTTATAAFNSGAQIVSTDYYRPDPRYKTKPKTWSSYYVKLPLGGVVNISKAFGLGRIGEMK